MLPVRRSAGTIAIRPASPWSSTYNARLRPAISKITPAPVSTTAYQRRRLLVKPQRQRHFSSSSRNDPNKNNVGSNDAATFSTLLTSVVGAGIGTLTSTMFALYLATIVETSAHDFLYGYFPSRYHDLSEDDLPMCLREREMARRGGVGGIEVYGGAAETSTVTSGGGGYNFPSSESFWEDGDMTEEVCAGIIGEGKARELALEANIGRTIHRVVSSSKRREVLRERLTNLAMTS